MRGASWRRASCEVRKDVSTFTSYASRTTNYALPLGNRFPVMRSGREVLELHAHFSPGEPGVVDLQQVHVARADALPDDDLAVGVKAAVVARAAKALAVAGHVDKAAGVGTDDVPRGNDVLAVL